MKKFRAGNKILITGTAVLLVIIALLPVSKEVVKKIKRPDYNEADYVYTLTVESESGEYTIDIPVSARKISGEDMQLCFDEAFEIIYADMKGNNPSLDEVRENLVFTEEIEKYGMTVQYSLNDYSVINCFGEVSNTSVTEAGAEYEIYANIFYDNLSQTYTIPVKVYPPIYTPEEEFVNKVSSEIAKQDAKSTSEEYMILPEKVEDIEISFWDKGESRIPIVICMAICGFLFWYYRKYTVTKNLAIKREKQMRMDYSEIVEKLLLLMGAGMSGRNAFIKIAADYQKEKGEVHYAYEEIQMAGNRISTGCSEEEVYSDFGRRCRIHCYIKLGSLMIQNIKKGGEDFMMLLREETSDAFNERKAMARKAGEEAGTKLLLPMMLMLLIVLVVIIVPAFMSF